MLPNPYSPGSLPTHLSGRNDQLEAIRIRIGRARALGRSGGPLLAFHGPRGYGKTSLLRAAQREAAESGCLTVWLTGRDDVSVLPDLVRELRGQLRSESIKDRARDVLSRLDQIEVELGVPGLKVGARARPMRSDALIEGVLAEAGRLAREGNGGGVAVFVDEFQEAQLADRRSLLIALQHFDGDPSPVVVVAAGLPSVLGAVPEAATFGERTDFQEVGALTDVAVAEALRLPAADVGTAWSDGAVEQAIVVTRGYPHHVQLLGETAWQAARPMRGDTIDVGHVRLGAEAAARRMTSLFRSRLARVAPEHRRFLDAMAVAGTDVVTRAAVAQRLGVTVQALGRPRQELMDRGLIESVGHGRLGFTIPGFGEHLRAELED